MPFLIGVVWFGISVIALMSLFSWYCRRPIKHYPQRHICGECRAAWTPDHQCFGYGAYRGSMYGEIWRRPTDIQKRGE